MEDHWGAPIDPNQTEDWGAHIPNFSESEPWSNIYTSDHIWPPKGVLIDGRDESQEKNWWNALGRMTWKRPGSGILPPLLAERLHNPEHTLFMVSVTPPDINPADSVQPSASSPQPTTQDVLEAVPHPHAYYCRRHNAWALLAWRQSSVFPELALSWEFAHPGARMPSQARRRKTPSCPAGNKTHHFHFYERSVEASSLNPGFNWHAWEQAKDRQERGKGAHRRMTLTGDEYGMKLPLDDNDEKPYLLDLYVCCQCSVYVVASPPTSLIPGVLDSKYVEEFTKSKMENPTVGKSPQESVAGAWETVLRVIEDKLWRGNNRLLSVQGRVFSAKVGWTIASRKIFESLGFMVEFPSHPSSPTGSTHPPSSPPPIQTASSSASTTTTTAKPPMLHPPSTDPTTQEGRDNMQRLLRAWVEISAWLVDYHRRFTNILKERETVPHKLWVKAESARESYQTAIGAHHQQLPRGGLPEILHGREELTEYWTQLGMTATSYDSYLLQYAYLAQCRCDPGGIPKHLTALTKLGEALRYTNDPGVAGIETLIVSERSRGRFTTSDEASAIFTLGFGAENSLKVEFDDDVDEAFIVHAWRDAVKRTWSEGEAGAVRRRELNEAFRIVGESRGTRELRDLWDEDRASGMTPEKAYATLEVPHNVDEEMLLTVYAMRVEDQPSQLNTMKDALKVIAELTGSERIQKFLDTGIDPGVIVHATRPDWPRGLNQLGNTCYLNSLLQYFYTIRDLREALAPLVSASDKFVDDDKLKDDDLKNHRVGGRIVTRREVMRSRKFVSQLANLFHLMENSNQPAVTPSLELAKLALVTSKDEEEDDQDRGGTDSSHSTDATLVDESVAPAVVPAVSSPKAKSSSPPARSPSSVLGKRPRGPVRRRTDMDIDVDGTEDGVADGQERDKDGYVIVEKPQSPTQERDKDGDGDVKMSESDRPKQPPPLPPRPKTQATTNSTSDMMFGKQHDVAECMDNCMFQIETALLQLGELAMPGSDTVIKRSVVKRLFYGKIRQRLSHLNDVGKSKSSIHEREDFFSHLPVNVSEESFDLYDGLSGYFDDVVEFEGKRARMEVTIVELPPILQIQLQRVQFNRETLQPYKSHAYVKFGETISMDRFLSDANPEKKARSEAIQAELNACRDRIQMLTQGKHAPYTDALDHSWDFLSHQQALDLPEVDQPFLDELKREGDFVKEEIDANRSRATQLKEQLEDVWSSETQAEYELTSVFVHRGASPTFGHYFIYQRWLPDYPDSWFKYNDSDVTVVSKEEVLADTTGSTANPYLLVFSRKGSEVIHTVQRVDPMAVENASQS
ncbi:cysteine proteinase [Rickenella mellea]|uniref:ubiquitinyl hydrolase 1 n=1 Tax=Rickenella mellea TaxID=50990 RepID=A0A4Y7PVH8_9AGAM|nr:cysteine proteinase [Rickenella mellea]